MKKFITLLTVSILVSGCSATPEDQVESIDQTETNQTQLEVSEEELTQEEADRQSEIEEDLQIYETTDQANQTLEDCEDFNDENAKSACQDNYHFNQAVQSNDPSSCQKIKDPQFMEICNFESSQEPEQS